MKIQPNDQQNKPKIEVAKLKKSVEFHMLFGIFLMVVSGFIFVFLTSFRDKIPYADTLISITFLISFSCLWILLIFFVMIYSTFVGDYIEKLYEK